MSKEELIKKLEEVDGYILVRELPGRGLCGLSKFIFTVGLCYGLDETGFSGRWCYHDMQSAMYAYLRWDGEGDPSGEWIKYKGRDGERSRLKEPSND